MLPLFPWSNYDSIIRAIGENQSIKDTQTGFLVSLGLVSSSHDLLTSTQQIKLTPLGEKYFLERFIRSDQLSSKQILQGALLTYAPVQAILQLLHGVKNATRDNVLTILKSRNFWQAQKDETPLTNLLLLLNEMELVVYSKKNRTVRVVYNVHLGDTPPPANIFIERSIPYSNFINLQKILASCQGYIYWIDKHFHKKALEVLWEIADANNIQEIKIISLEPPKELLQASKEEYGKLQIELANKKISLQWFVIDSKLVRDNHDRWIAGKGVAWNVPDVNTVLSGNRSEIHKSNFPEKVTKAFKDYWKQSTELV